MIGMEILKPMVALTGWTMVIWLWMYATRIPAMLRQGIKARSMVGGTGKDLDAVLPANVQWKAHNFNNLHESPTVFYAIALVLAVIGHGDGRAATLAWLYVGLRIVHSLVQVTFNRVLLRFALYVASSLVLIGLIWLAAQALWGNPAGPALIR